jgi:hypothetical protein
VDKQAEKNVSDKHNTFNFRAEGIGCESGDWIQLVLKMNAISYSETIFIYLQVYKRLPPRRPTSISS